MVIYFCQRKESILTKDFTEGNLYQHLLTLSIPLIFGNILQQFYNTIDAFVVGRYAGNEPFAAIGIASTIMNLFLFMIVGACIGLSVLFAHYYGSKDFDRLRRQHFIAFVSGLIFSILLCVIGLIGLPMILKLVQTPDNLFQYTYSYLWWVFLALPASFLYNMYASALRSSGDSLAALCILGAAVCLNLVFDLLLVIRFQMGIQGAAFATFLTQYLSALLCVLYLCHSHKEFLFHKEDCHFSRNILSVTLQCCSATALQQTNLYIGKTLVQGIINTGGTDMISAYTAATRIEGFANSFGDSGSAATSVLVSQNFGSHQKKRIEKSFRCSVVYLGILGICSSLILFVSAPQTISLMLGNNSTIAFEAGVQYLRIVSIFYVLCFLGNSFTGYFAGLKKISVTVIGTTSHIALRVLLSWLFFKDFQLNTVAIATGVGWIWCNLYWAYKKKKTQVPIQ